VWHQYFLDALLVEFDIREFGKHGIPNCVIIHGDQGSEADSPRPPPPPRTVTTLLLTMEAMSLPINS
jgi:hypothetical protein